MLPQLRLTCRQSLPRSFTRPSSATSTPRLTPLQCRVSFPARRSFVSKPTTPLQQNSKPAQIPKSHITRSPPPPKDFARTDVKLPAQVIPKSFVGTKGNGPPTPGPGKGYPERLLIYHAGTGRTVFISCVKLTAIFIFIFSAVLVAPAYYFSAYEPTWMAGVVVAGGAVPLLFMVLTSSPFVTYVHLALPLWARASYPRLARYAQNLPSTASVDITTLRWIWPRVTRLNVSELHIHKSQIGAMTIRRTVPQGVLDGRQWWQWRPLKTFYVSGKGGRTVEKGIWEEVVGCVAKGWGRKVPKSD